MAVREFNGTSNELVTGIGAASAMAYGTVAALLKFSTTTSFRDWTMLHDSGGSYAWSPSGLTNFSTLQMDNHGAASDSGINPGTTAWKLVVVRKATGTTAPRFSVYDYTSAAWTHAAGALTLANSSFPPGVGGQVRFTYQNSSDYFGGRIAARALWSNALPWTADAAGDAAIAASGLKDAAFNWLSNNPSAFWLFNQASTATAVADLSTTGTAGQTSISGTTVITGDDPPGFNFSLTATPLVAWNFDEASGAALDQSGNGRSFTVSGNTVRTASGSGHTDKGLTQTVAEASAGPSITGLQTTNRTWMAWVKYAASVTAWVMEFYDSVQDTGRWGLLDLTGTVRFRAKDASNTVFESTSIARNVGTWQHIAASHDGANLRTYVNGSLLSTTAMASAVGTSDTVRVLDQTGSNVVIDDVRLYDQVLGAATITSLMNTPVSGSVSVSIEGWGIPLG